MKCKVSKVMTKVLNETFKVKGYCFHYLEMSMDQYQLYVDYDLLNHEEDFKIENSKMKVITLSYPDEYYACDKYITTRDLKKCLRECETNDYRSFAKSVWNFIEI